MRPDGHPHLIIVNASPRAVDFVSLRNRGLSPTLTAIPPGGQTKVHLPTMGRDKLQLEAEIIYPSEPDHRAPDQEITVKVEKKPIPQSRPGERRVPLQEGEEA